MNLMFVRHRLLLLLCLLGGLAAGEAERVRLQLNWFHQFQFAGIYAAELRGYFADEGLAVEIAERQPDGDVLLELAEGRCQFAIYDSTLLMQWAAGRDVALVAVIMQRYPRVLLVRADSPYRTLADLLADPRARLVGPPGPIGPELRVALAALGRTPESAFPRPRRPGDLERFAAGELDMLPGYLTNEPFRLRRLGVETRPLQVFEGRESLFFGDALVCRGDLWRQRPDLVNRLRRAVLRGWAWALDHPQEMVAAIAARWPSAHQAHDPAQLADEAQAVAALINREVVPLGTIHRARLEAIAGTLRAAGQPGLVRADLVWSEPDPDRSWLRIALGALAAAALLSALLAVAVWLLRRRVSALHASHQQVLELAEGFCVFHARIGGGSRILLLDASPSIANVLGQDLAAYRRDPDALLRQVLPEDRDGFILAVQTAASARQPLRHRFRLRRPGEDAPRHLLIHALPRREAAEAEFDGLVIDVTAEAEALQAVLEAQRRLEAAQRHESLGLLASGIAHDFNNLLGAMRGNAELALLRLPAGHEARPPLERVLQAADRAANLVRQIMAYAGKGTIEVRTVDLVEECRILADLLRHTVGPQVPIRIEPVGQPPPVLFDPAQLQQVLINLIVNAAESYEGRPGTVTVRIAHDERRPDRVRVEVIDQGCGMDEATQRRMFEPFFTTKPTGHGLGLAAVHGICRASGAELQCRSAPGQGTTFTVWLPAAERSAGTRTVSDLTPAGVRRMLVADDDALMRETILRMAERLGYEAEAVADGAEAAARLDDPSRQYDVILLDCVMPGIAGSELARQRRERGDRRPIVLMSGIGEGVGSGTAALDRHTRVLMKPFSRAMLARTLTLVLRGEEDSSAATFAALQRESGAFRRQRPPSEG